MYEVSYPPTRNERTACPNCAIGEMPTDGRADFGSARLKLAEEFGRTGGAGATRRRRAHHHAPRRPGSDVHAAFTARLKAGVTRRIEAGKHDSRPRIASTELIRMTWALHAHSFLEQFAIRADSPVIRAFVVAQAFHSVGTISF